MDESKYTQAVLDRFKTDFQDGWIDVLDWETKDGKKALFKTNMMKIAGFRIFAIENYAKMALSGDHLLHENKGIGALQDCLHLDEVEYKDKSLKTQLHNNFQALLMDINEITLLAKNHIKRTKAHFSANDEFNDTYDLVSFGCYRDNRDPMVGVLDLVFDVCEMEYDFSYDDDYTRSLLRYRRRLQDVSSKNTGVIKSIVNSCISKIELLLGKLSVFSKDKKIKYNFNFTPEIFKLDNPDDYKSDDYRHLYLKFLDPSLIDAKTVKEWHIGSKKEDVKMWQLAYLMRYHVKCTKNVNSVEELIKLADFHHDDYNKKEVHNIVNDYADCSFLNYMYNSRFSFMCQNVETYSYADMKRDLEKIESIQHDTSIFNYHPYQKAIEFTLRWIENKLADSSCVEDLSSMVGDLNGYFKTLKDNMNWCMHHQPYLMQLRYNFSCISTELDDLKMFCPSSICRPLQFQRLQEKISIYAAKIAIVEYEAKHQKDKKSLNEAKAKIETMDRKNLEHLGLFTSVITFLVGLLSIFVGNSGGVSLFERMEYVFVLGLILVIFVCLGFFVIGSSMQKQKPYIFGGVLISCFIALIIILFRMPSIGNISGTTQNCVRRDSVAIHLSADPFKIETSSGVNNQQTSVVETKKTATSKQQK